MYCSSFSRRLFCCFEGDQNMGHTHTHTQTHTHTDTHTLALTVTSALAEPDRWHEQGYVAPRVFSWQHSANPCLPRGLSGLIALGAQADPGQARCREGRL